MSSFRVSELNYKKTCRTCLKQEKDGISLKQIFCETITLIVISEIFKMRLKVSKNDGLPQSICNECVDSLIYIHKFRKLCEKSQKILDLSHTIVKPVSIEMSPRHELEFVNVGVLLNAEDENETEPRLEIQLKKDILSDDDVTCSSDTWIQNEMVESVAQSEENQNNSNINQICLTCHYCKKIFETIDLLDIHIKRDHSIKRRTHICPICGKNFATPEGRKRHIESHNDNFPYACDICDRAFTCKIYLTKHKKVVHTGLKPYLCNTCGNYFRHKYNLSLHLRTHTGERPYKCNLCSKAYHHLSSLKYHTISVHKVLIPINQRAKDLENGNTVESAPIIEGIAIASKINSENDVEITNESKSIKLKETESKQRHANHERIHTGLKPYLCNICDKLFRRKYHLTRHLRNHMGEHPYKCDLCSKTYKTSSSLKYHKISVHDVLIPIDQRAKDLKNGNMVESAPIIEGIAISSKVNSENDVEITNESKFIKLKETASKRHHANHERIHTGLKPYLCNICGKHFRQEYHLTRHLRTHTMGRLYKCDLCSKVYKQSTQLKYHKISVHYNRSIIII